MSRDDEYLEAQPGYVFEAGAAIAKQDQRRAQILDLVRTSGKVSVTVADGNGDDVIHWAHVDASGSTPSFLAHVAWRAANDLAAALDGNKELACAVIREAVMST